MNVADFAAKIKTGKPKATPVLWEKMQITFHISPVKPVHMNALIDLQEIAQRFSEIGKKQEADKAAGREPSGDEIISNTRATIKALQDASPKLLEILGTSFQNWSGMTAAKYEEIAGMTGLDMAPEEEILITTEDDRRSALEFLLPAMVENNSDVSLFLIGKVFETTNEYRNEKDAEKKT